MTTTATTPNPFHGGSGTAARPLLHESLTGSTCSLQDLKQSEDIGKRIADVLENIPEFKQFSETERSDIYQFVLGCVEEHDEFDEPEWLVDDEDATDIIVMVCEQFSEEPVPDPVPEPVPEPTTRHLVSVLAALQGTRSRVVKDEPVLCKPVPSPPRTWGKIVKPCIQSITDLQTKELSNKPKSKYRIEVTTVVVPSVPVLTIMPQPGHNWDNKCYRCWFEKDDEACRRCSLEKDNHHQAPSHDQYLARHCFPQAVCRANENGSCDCCFRTNTSDPHAWTFHGVTHGRPLDTTCLPLITLTPRLQWLMCASWILNGKCKCEKHGKWTAERHPNLTLARSWRELAAGKEICESVFAGILCQDKQCKRTKFHPSTSIHGKPLLYQISQKTLEHCARSLGNKDYTPSGKTNCFDFTSARGCSKGVKCGRWHIPNKSSFPFSHPEKALEAEGFESTRPHIFFLKQKMKKKKKVTGSVPGGYKKKKKKATRSVPGGYKKKKATGSVPGGYKKKKKATGSVPGGYKKKKATGSVPGGHKK